MLTRILDIEVQNHPHFGGVAVPYCPDNYVVEVGWQDFDAAGNPVTDILSKRYESREEADAARTFSLDGVGVVVCHNLQFELSWWLVRYREDFLRFYNRGGRFLCTAMAEYLITAQQTRYPSLEETAVKYGGMPKLDGIKALWKAGVLTADIDAELLHKYLTDPEQGDIANTARVYYAQQALLAEQNMWQLFLMRCDALVSYAMCETAGLHIDMEVAQRNLAEHTEELRAVDAEVEKMLPADMPAGLEFSWSSLHHRSALLFGGPVKYPVRIPYAPPAFVKADFWKVDGERVPVVEGAVPPPGADRYARGKNAGQVKVYREDTDEIRTKWGEAVYTFPGLVDIRKLPEVLRNKLTANARGRPGEWMTALTLCDNITPVYSTGEEVVMALAEHGVASADSLARRSVLNKDIGTYYRVEVRNKDGSLKETKGMLQFVDDTSIIHHTLNATATETGRLAHTRPNMGNLPRGDKDGEGRKRSRVKEMFTSRFGSEGAIVEVDYSALEVVVNAAISGDAALLKHLQDGTDMHCLRLATKEGLPYDYVYERCKNEDHPDHATFKQMRSAIKPVAFAAQYGASAAGLAFATGVSLEFAEGFLAAEAKLFPQSIAFRDVVLKEVQRTADGNYSRELVGDTWRVYRRGYYTAPDGTRYSFREHPVWDAVARREVMALKPTQIANYWNQGIAANLMAVSMARSGRWLAKNEFFRNEMFPQGRAFLINNVHDAVYFDVHNSVLDRVTGAAKKILEHAPIYMSERLGYNIEHVPFPAAAEYGPSMADKTSFH